MGAGKGTADIPLADEEDGKQNLEFGVGVEGGVGEAEHEGPREADVGTGERDGLGVEGDEEEMQELEECRGGGRVLGGKSLLEPLFLSEPEESDSLCLFEDGGGGRRGTWGSGLHSWSLGCISGFALMDEVRSDSSSRSKESNCTTTSSTSATCGTSSHADLVREGTGDGDTEVSLCSF